MMNNMYERETSSCLSLTCYEADCLLVVDADQVSVLGDAVVFSILPCFNRFTLKVIAVIPVEEISLITVKFCSERNRFNIKTKREKREG